MSHFRWLATVKYRTDAGISEVDHQFEEMFDLHDLIERGPDWNCIENIHIELNPRRKQYDDTVEQSSRRTLSPEQLLALLQGVKENSSLLFPDRSKRS